MVRVMPDFIRLKGVALLLLCAILVACEGDWFEEGPTELEAARSAMQRNEWGMAQQILEHVLADEQNPDIRCEAWLLITEASRNLAPGGTLALAQLKAAESEFRDDPDRLVLVQKQQVSEYIKLHKHRRAADILLQVVCNDKLSKQDLLQSYTRLARLELRLGNSVAAEEAYHNCLKLDLTPQERAERLMGLADVYIVRNEFEKAAASLEEALVLPQVDAQTRAQLLFLQGDVLEEQGEDKKALEIFRQARSEHVHPAVVSYRIEMLEAKILNAGKPAQSLPWGMVTKNPSGTEGRESAEKKGR